MKEEIALMTSYSPYRSLLSFKEEKSMEVFDTSEQENANVTMKTWRSIKRVARRFMRRKRKFVVGLVKRVVLACARKVKRKVLRINILNAKSSGNARHVLLNYDMCSYSKNFDDGKWQQEEVEYYRTRSFAYRFGQQAHSLAL